ncbi:hypothetical protein JCGZ_11189 [Jatropha curcas]|uniref:Uncharacterized protein n=1 Tax=Jatropha curcas TaxID=180498 RepID=A0A067KFD7_JATCU|nr:hypothetical protein JCGZ_11189 [Jatropha curcas]
MARGRGLIQTCSAVVRVEVVSEDAVHLGEEGLSLLFFLLIRVHLGLHLLLSLTCRHHFLLFLPLLPIFWTSRVFTSFTFTYCTRLENEPTPMEVFTYTHTKDHDGNTFVNRCALGVNHLTLLEPPHDHSVEEISALWARVDVQEQQLAELRAHVMRMSDQHSASTSSSNPPPATNPHVSIALHQPLSSLLIPILQTIPWSLLPTLRHIQRIFLPTLRQWIVQRTDLINLISNLFSFP